MLSGLFGRLSISQKMIFMIGLALLALAIDTIFINNGLTKIKHHMEEVSHQDLPLIKLISEATIAQLEQEVVLERRFRALDSAALKRKFDELGGEVEHFFSEALDILAAAALQRDAVGAVKMLDLHQQIEKLNKEHHGWQQKVNAALAGGELSKQRILAIEEESDKFTHAVEALLLEIEDYTEQSLLKVEDEEQSLIYNSIIVFVVNLAILAPLAWLVINSFKSSVAGALDSISHFAAGDMTQQLNLDSEDEIGELMAKLSEMQNRLKAVLISIGDAAYELGQAAQDLVSTSENSSQNIQLQTDEARAAMLALSDIDVTVKEVSRLSASTMEQARAADDAVAGATKVMDQAISAIDNVHQTTEKSHQLMTDLEEHSSKIFTVLDVIKSIADQTNLLALNAAIEAARAGEMGRGFAVVADEVRTLAQRTQDSTGEIEEMINALKRMTQDAAKAISTSFEFTGQGVEASKQAQTEVDSVAQVVSAVSDMNQQISTAAGQQELVLSDLNEKLFNIEASAEGNAQNMAESLASSQTVAGTADKLNQSVDRFKL